MRRTGMKLATFTIGTDGPLLGVVDDAGGVVAFLSEGDGLELEVERIGVLRNRLVR
jgi:2-keto-4-pentenoate hydratase/2-oxohepta-3-ene-1,7-dioic acid hydratase in catechol pathway